MGAAASVPNGEVVSRQLAKNISGDAWDEEAWERIVASSSPPVEDDCVPGDVWNAAVAEYASRASHAMDEANQFASAQQVLRRPGLADRDLESEEWYFAVGGLVNPAVAHAFGLAPVSSLPAVLVRGKWRLAFTARDAVVAAEASSGASTVPELHGVALKVPAESMDAIDTIVAAGAAQGAIGVGSSSPAIRRVRAWARLYQDVGGGEIECWAHVLDTPPQPTEGGSNSEGAGTASSSNEVVPEERLVEALVQGCVALGVDGGHVDRLRSTRPTRTRSEDCCLAEGGGEGQGSGLRSFAARKGLAAWSEAVVAKAHEDASKLGGFVTMCNGKVLAYRPGNGSARSAGSASSAGSEGPDTSQSPLPTSEAAAALGRVLGGRDAELWGCRDRCAILARRREPPLMR